MRTFSAFVAVLVLASASMAEPPATQPVRSVAEIERTIPAGVVPKHSGEWNAMKLNVAGKALNQNVGKTIEMTVEVIQIHQDDDGHWVRARPLESSALPVNIDARCQQVDPAGMARLEPGDQVKLEAIINYVKLRPRSDNHDGVLLDINLTQGRFLAMARRAGEAAPADPPAAPPVLGDLDAVVKTIPVIMLPAKDEVWNAAQLDGVNKALSQRVVGRQLRSKVKVGAVVLEREMRYVVDFQLAPYDTFQVDVRGSFGVDQLQNVARLKPGQSVTVQGLITKASMTPDGFLMLFVGAGQIVPE